MDRYHVAWKYEEMQLDPDGDLVRYEDAVKEVTAERERCASVVRGFIWTRPRTDAWINEVLRNILDAIRGHTEQP